MCIRDSDYIDGKNKPKFTVDTDKALELLRGAGIYEGDQQCIRELLQNAVDATLIRIWLDHKDSNKDFSCPNSKDFIDLLPQYWISVNIHERQIEGEYKNWLLEIQDNGTGTVPYTHLIQNDKIFREFTVRKNKRNSKRGIICPMEL